MEVDLDFNLDELGGFDVATMEQVGSFGEHAVTLINLPLSSLERVCHIVKTAHAFSQNSGLDLSFYKTDHSLKNRSFTTINTHERGQMQLCSSEVDEEAQEHFDNAREALIDGVGHAIAAGVTIVECPPLGAYEAYKAVDSFLEMGHEYCEGVRLEEEDYELDESN